MPDLNALGVDRALVEHMYEEWKARASKSALGRRYFNKGESHGKLFTALVKQELGVDTEQASRLGREIRDLREENARLRDENQALQAALEKQKGGGS